MSMSRLKEFFNGFSRGFKEFGHKSIGMLVNSALLFFVYLFGVGLSAVIAKISGKRFLDKEISKKSKSYWSKLDLKKKPVEEYYRQF